MLWSVGGYPSIGCTYVTRKHELPDPAIFRFPMNEICERTDKRATLDLSIPLKQKTSTTAGAQGPYGFPS